MRNTSFFISLLTALFLYLPLFSVNAGMTTNTSTANPQLKTTETNNLPKDIKADTANLSTEKTPIVIVWQHADKKAVDFSELAPVPGVNTVSPCWYALQDADGTVEDKSVENYVSKSRARGYRVWPLINNGFNPEITEKLLKNPQGRRQMIEFMRYQAEKHGFDGWNLDFENVYEKDKDALTAFIAEICREMHKEGLKVSVDVTVPDGSPNWSLCLDRKAIADHADYIVLMGYDQYSRSSPRPGPTAAFNWSEDRLKATLKEVPQEKLILGMPLYMRLWTLTPDKKLSALTLDMKTAKKISLDKIECPDYLYQWSPQEKMYYCSYSEQNKHYCFWQENALSLKEKISLVGKYNLAGAAFWRKGFETPEIWDLVKTELKSFSY